MNFNHFLDLAVRKGFAPNFTSLALKGQHGESANYNEG